MGLLGKAAVFAAREIARPALEKLGEHLGDAVGRRLKRRIDPEGVDDPEDEGSDPDADGVPGA